jgi:GNAT superfamily N-acetyltransferase
MDTYALTRRILDQRRQRFPYPVPDLDPAGSALSRPEGMLLRVAYAVAAPGAAPGVVGDVMRYAASRGLAVHWTVMPALYGEGEFPSALLARGFRREESQRLMAHEGRLNAPANPRVTIVPISSWTAMLSYEEGSRASFFDDPYPRPAVVEYRTHERMRDQGRGWSRYYAAHLDGRPVGGCYTTQFEDVPTLMGVYTLPAAQRLGVATTLLGHVVSDLVADGHAACCLFVRLGNPAENLYRRLDFHPLLDEYTFLSDRWASS